MQHFIDLISTLQAEHESLKQAMFEIATSGPASPTGRALLEKIENSLMQHLQKEDEILFPMLLDKVNSNEIARQTVRFINDQNKTLAMDFLEFFQLMENGKSDEVDINRSFVNLLDLLLYRIELEEAQLYNVIQAVGSAGDGPSG